jgi:hypothetical protein
MNRVQATIDRLTELLSVGNRFDLGGMICPSGMSDTEVREGSALLGRAVKAGHITEDEAKTADKVLRRFAGATEAERAAVATMIWELTCGMGEHIEKRTPQARNGARRTKR